MVNTGEKMRTFILPAKQRKAIQRYLKERPNLMPETVRQVRVRAKEADFDQMREDIKLLEELRALDLKIGRPVNSYADQAARFQVRQNEESEVRAELKVKR